MATSLLILFITSLLTVTPRAELHGKKYSKFPKGFKLGVGSSSYQNEGAWNISDKGINVWDEFTHRIPSPIADGSNGDIASDSYHKYKEDIELLRDLGVDSYRLSLSWSRILPTGFTNKISKTGIEYYKNLLDGLNAAGIEPMVSLYHWDHPAVLEEMGGWTNEMMVRWFVDYAEVVFKHLGDKIKIFATINEPGVACSLGYGSGLMAPGKKLQPHGPYLCLHNMLKAHAKVYKLYDRKFRETQKGEIGIAINCQQFYPKNRGENKSAYIEFEFECDLVAHPIYSKKGDYPELIKDQVAANSRIEGYKRSKLRNFTQSEIDDLRGSADFFGLNHYTSMLVEQKTHGVNTAVWNEHRDTVISSDSKWSKSPGGWPYVVPKGFGDILRILKNKYNNTKIYVMENGASDKPSNLCDHERIKYLRRYLRHMLKAIRRDGCKVAGYWAWSFLDSFEWMAGYKGGYGMVRVDYKHPNRTRTPKMSFQWYKDVLRARKLQPYPPSRGSE